MTTILTGHALYEYLIKHFGDYVYALTTMTWYYSIIFDYMAD